MQSLEQKEFTFGTIDSAEDVSIPRGAASASKNWQTLGTKIELRRGYARLGLTDAGSGRVSGLIVTKKADGTEIPVRSRARKIEYYDSATDDWIEVGTNILPTAANDEDISFANYQPIYGPELHWNSPNTGPHKIKTANMGDYVALYDSTKNFKGRIAIKQNRTFLWDRTGTGTVTDKTGLYGSYIDKDENTDFTQISAEAIGSSGLLTYTGTLAFKAAGTLRTCLEVTFTDTSETFIDDLNGVLVGSAGGTGTINYMTGAYSVTFAVAAVGSVTATYRWENATSTGICDFTKSGTRTAGQGFIFRQDENGTPFQNIMSINDVEYCFHKTKTWALTLSRDDTAATNYIYRDRVGIPNHRAAVETADGVYYIDDTDRNDPHFRLLTLDNQAAQVIPISVSKRLKIANERVGVDLSAYRFDKAAMIEYGDLIVIACRTSDSSSNNTVFTYNKKSKAIDRLDYYATSFAIYNGTLIAGDSTTNNVYTLFSGSDDDGVEIDNSWEGKLDDLGVESLKTIKKILLKGQIGPDQEIHVYQALDNGSYTEILDSDGGVFISGTGSYVDRTQAVLVGSQTLGQGIVAGGSPDAIVAYNYQREVKTLSDKCGVIKLKFVATKLGYASVTSFEYKDIRVKWKHIPNKYAN